MYSVDSGRRLYENGDGEIGPLKVTVERIDASEATDGKEYTTISWKVKPLKGEA